MFFSVPDVGEPAGLPIAGPAHTQVGGIDMVVPVRTVDAGPHQLVVGGDDRGIRFEFGRDDQTGNRVMVGTQPQDIFDPADWDLAVGVGG